MRKLICLLAILPSFLLISCGPEHPEQPEGTYAKTGDERTDNPDCTSTVSVTCEGPGEDCDFEGTRTETVKTCNGKSNVNKPDAIIELEKYTSLEDFSSFFSNINCYKILPSLRYNKRIISYIKDAKLSASIFSNNVLVINKPGKKGLNIDKDALFFCSINPKFISK
jgi:hypothetical protein